MPEKKEEKINEEIPPEEFAEISVELDTYDDIFSDFDPRPYSERAVSADFLEEMKRRIVESKEGKMEIRFVLPAKMRNPKVEVIIRKRLRDYFRMETREAVQEAQNMRKKGIMLISGGAFLLLLVGLIYAKFQGEMWATVAEILLTPPGWFSMWVGLDKLIEKPSDYEHESMTKKRLAEGDFIFISLETVERPHQTRLSD